MKSAVLVLIFTASLFSEEEKKPSRKNPPAQTMTGCLDQRNETYVLRDLTKAARIATLRGKTFSDDNFARYVGHKVTVHGDVQNDGENVVVHVSKIDDGGAGCTPSK